MVVCLTRKCSIAALSSIVAAILINNVSTQKVSCNLPQLHFLPHPLHQNTFFATCQVALQHQARADIEPKVQCVMK